MERRRGRLRHARARWHPDHWQTIQPTTQWQTMKTSLHANYLRRRHRPLLHQREQAVVRARTKAKGRLLSRASPSLPVFGEDLVRLPDHNLVDPGFLRDLRACVRVSLILPRSHPLRELPRIHPQEHPVARTLRRVPFPGLSIALVCPLLLEDLSSVGLNTNRDPE